MTDNEMETIGGAALMSLCETCRLRYYCIYVDIKEFPLTECNDYEKDEERGA